MQRKSQITKNVANKDTKCILKSSLSPAVILARHKTSHVRQTKCHITADPQPYPCRPVPCSQRYPDVAHDALNPWPGWLIWLQFFTPSLTRFWPSHCVSWLCLPIQKLPNICAVETKLIQLRRHQVASQRVSPSGGWLRGWVWADYLPRTVCEWLGGEASFSKWMIFRIDN